MSFSDGDEAEAFLTGLYRIFLEREPDADGLRYYRQALLSGCSVLDTIAQFASSTEFRDKEERRVLEDVAGFMSSRGILDPAAVGTAIAEEKMAFPIDYDPIGECGKSYRDRVRSGFMSRYCSGPVVLDVGFAGYDNPEGRAALPHAIGVDLNYPGYDGITLPFEEGSVDTVFSSHCLEHILHDHAAIRDWFRVLKVGGFIVCMVPSQSLYEKRRFLPSRFNSDHKRMYTPSSLAASFETALDVNSYRLRHLAENDRGYDYGIGPNRHATGAYEIELVVEKVEPPFWNLA